MTVMLCLEAIAGVILFGYTIVGFAQRGDDELLPAVSIVVVAALSAFWVGATFLALTRKQHWARGSAVTIQIFIFSVAVGAFQGFYAQPLVGWALAIPAAVTFVAAILARGGHLPPVSDVTSDLGEPKR